MTKKLNKLNNKEAMLKALENNLGNVSAACKKTKTGRTQHYNWYNTDKKYKLAVDDIQESLIDLAESTVYKTMIYGKDNVAIDAAKFFLKTKGKKRGYIEKIESDITHKGDGIKFIIERVNERDKSTTK